MHSISALICFIAVTSSNAARLGFLHENLKLEPIKYTPDATYFLRKHVHESYPMHIKNFDKTNGLRKLLSQENLVNSLGDAKGRVYKGRMNASTWPIEVKMTFQDFIAKAPDNQLYWDALFPTSHQIYTELPLPFCTMCDAVLKSSMEYNMLYTFWNVSSLFHHDGSENLFYQVKGKKTWLLADQSQSPNAYANNYTLQAGLSPVDPENVDMDKYPKVKDIKFIEVVTEPGDLLYIPEYWWHQVRTEPGENVGINLWLEYFDFAPLKNGIDDVLDVASGAELFASNRKNALQPKCDYFSKTLADIKPGKSDDGYILYYGVDDGNFYSLNSKTGEVLWKYEIDGDAGSTGVLSDDASDLYFAGENRFVYNFDKDGNVKWSTGLGDGATASLRLLNSKVIATCLDGHVYALDSSNGNILWKSEQFSGELWTSPGIYGNYIVIGVLATKADYKGPTVIMIDSENGNAVWKYATSGDIFASPAMDLIGNQVFVADHSGYVYSLHLKTGEMLWKYDIKQPIDSSPVVNPDGTLFISGNGQMFAIDTATKTTNWIKQLSTETSISSPLVVPELDRIYVAIGKLLYCLNSSTGDILWQYIAEDTFMSSPRIDKMHILYIGGIDRYIYAFNAINGEIKWKTETGGPVVGSAVIPNKFLINSYGALL